MKVAFVLKGYPRLSETFIAQEIRALERRGLAIEIWSLRHPTDTKTHPITREIAAPVTYLPEYLHQEPARVFRAWQQARQLPGYPHAKSVWLRDLKRDPTRNRVRRFGQAMVLAAELGEDADGFHFHFLHTPASVTRYAALMRGLPFSGSAHAKDIWTIPEWEKREKLADLAWLSTCTGVGAAHLRSLESCQGGGEGPEPTRVHLDYHGLDLERFPLADSNGPSPDVIKSKDSSVINSDVVTILSVGRAVEKKGYDDLLKALAALPPGLPWRFRHIGGGPLRGPLKQQAADLKISDRVEWLGAQSQETVLAELRSADIFVLASKISADGDRDGLPNVLMEAQSQGLAAVSTTVSAIPELIVDGETGLLVQPEDPMSLSGALARLIEDTDLRRCLGDAGADRVRSQFNADNCITQMAARFGLAAPSKGEPHADPIDTAHVA